MKLDQPPCVQFVLNFLDTILKFFIQVFLASVSKDATTRPVDKDNFLAESILKRLE